MFYCLYTPGNLKDDWMMETKEVSRKDSFGIIIFIKLKRIIFPESRYNNSNPCYFSHRLEHA